MTAPGTLGAEDRRLWGRAGGVALAAHLGLAAMVLAWSRPHAPTPPEPAVLVELPPLSAPAPANPAAEPAQPQPQPATPQPAIPPIQLPPVQAPLPQSPVTLPPPSPPQPVHAAPAPPAPPTPTAPAAPVANAIGTDPRAKKAELDYFAQLSAHLNRRKSYPSEARKARQEGVVVIRFTVDRDGNVSGASIKRTSGFDLLDQATLQLLQRVAPLPKMPASMPQASVTIALPIEYALKTS